MAVLFLLTGVPRPAAAQPADGETLDITIRADEGETTISRHIYGHFAEHLGRDIYGGFWVQRGEGSSGEGAGRPGAGQPDGPPGGWQYNEDVIEALRRIDIPNLRWPGGCFADYYHWRDGVGPKDERPPVVNTLWGGAVEDNSFGTHEFMGLARRLGTEPIVVGNVGSGQPEEMANWWQYVNGSKESPMGQLRAQNGHPEPWSVKYWGVGNESWGCGGNMTPSYYADLYKRFATFLRPAGGTEPFRVATGPSGDNYEWTRTLMKEAGGMIDGLDLHYYTITGTWADKGSATDFNRDEWFSSMESAFYIDELVTRHSAIMDEHDPENNTALIVGEWGLWHDRKPGAKSGFLYQQNTLRDAVVAAIHLNVFNRHADRVKMANIAQTVNVLQAMILTKGDEMILTPTYHVFDMYKAHQDATLLPMEWEQGAYRRDEKKVPAISASASMGDDGAVHLTVANVDPAEGRTVTTTLDGTPVSDVSGRILTADAMNARNTFENPDALEPTPFTGAALEGATLTLDLPPKSVVALELE
jgi:alpha-N-arabinofuranosidase